LSDFYKNKCKSKKKNKNNRQQATGNREQGTGKRCLCPSKGNRLEEGVFQAKATDNNKNSPCFVCFCLFLFFLGGGGFKSTG